MPAEIYSVRSGDAPEAYIFQKYDSHLEPLSRYLMTKGECSCPRGETGKMCRHMKMLPAFIKYKHINDGFMLNYNTGQWIEPPKFIAEAAEEARRVPLETTFSSEHKSMAPKPSASYEQLPPSEAQVLASPPASAQAVSGGGSTLGPTYKRRI